MGFWYNVVQILPDNWLESKYRFVSAVRAPISLGIGPAEEFKIAVQLVRDHLVRGMSFNGIFVCDYGTMSYKSYLISRHWSPETGMSVP